ncbi:hypothetical protein PAHAL_8G186000 [Panicum hallii]|jgi:hypothetical protein|uniref:Uncharacterized protein n=1 Tax=Panicum hallii TaxID=206008 RepID=A0A2T8I9D0_9POAL|nr:hypothetical protein PAHAL_8G186000 [Panicum hallii]
MELITNSLKNHILISKVWTVLKSLNNRGAKNVVDLYCDTLKCCKDMQRCGKDEQISRTVARKTSTR